jgi:DNA polymerase III epsilon subunit-like protein
MKEPGKLILGLKAILEALEIPFHHLHVAGNDAHFTAKALLMLAVRGTRNAGIKLNEDQEEMMAKLEAIGKASIDAELSKPTPDVERYRKKALAKKNEKENARPKEQNGADFLDHLSGFAELET